MSQVKIELLSQATFDAPIVGRAMSEAFLQEPNFVYVLPELDRRRKALTWFFGTFVSQLGFRQGKVYGPENQSGQAVWINPGKQMGFLEAMQAGFFLLPFHLGVGGLARFMALGRYVEALRTETAPDRHWYLMALGVSPVVQGQGIGSALLNPLLAQADNEQTPCYLETFSERNLDFYGKHGFEVTKASQVVDGPIFWGMVREPQRSGT